MSIGTKFNKGTFQCCVVDVPRAVIISCLLAGITGCLRSQCVVTTSVSERSDKGVSQCISLSGKLHSRIPDQNPELSKVAIAVREVENFHDRHEDTCCTVGHLPQEISQETFLLLKMGGAIKGEPRKRSDLRQSGLKVLWMLVLEHHCQLCHSHRYRFNICDPIFIL